MNSSSLSQLPALLALGNGATFALDLEEWTVGVVARRGSVALYARFACVVCQRWGGKVGRADVDKYQANFLSLIRTWLTVRKTERVKKKQRQTMATTFEEEKRRKIGRRWRESTSWPSLSR